MKKSDPQAILKFQEVTHWSGMVRSPQQCRVLTAECSDRVSGMSPSDRERSPLSKHQHSASQTIYSSTWRWSLPAQGHRSKKGRFVFECATLLLSHWIITSILLGHISRCVRGCSVWDVRNGHSQCSVFSHYEAFHFIMWLLVFTSNVNFKALHFESVYLLDQLKDIW